MNEHRSPPDAPVGSTASTSTPAAAGRQPDGRQIGRFVILAGGAGIVFGAFLISAADESRRSFIDRSSSGALALSLLLLGLAAWHFRAWGLGKLIPLGLMAAAALQFTLFDFADGRPVWDQGHEGGDLVARWFMIFSAAVVLLGVLWSVVETRPSAPRSEAMTRSLAWWRKWWLAVVGALVALWLLGLVFSETDQAPPIEVEDDTNQIPIEDEWTITPDQDIAGSYIISMIRTFRPLEVADLDHSGGYLVWPETEIELCDVDLWAVGDGFVQLGVITPTTEGCPGMLPAFIEIGLPETACLFVHSNGMEDEHCSPLTLR